MTTVGSTQIWNINIWKISVLHKSKLDYYSHFICYPYGWVTSWHKPEYHTSRTDLYSDYNKYMWVQTNMTHIHKVNTKINEAPRMAWKVEKGQG